MPNQFDLRPISVLTVITEIPAAASEAKGEELLRFAHFRSVQRLSQTGPRQVACCFLRCRGGKAADFTLFSPKARVGETGRIFLGGSRMRGCPVSSQLRGPGGCAGEQSGSACCSSPLLFVSSRLGELGGLMRSGASCFCGIRGLRTCLHMGRGSRRSWIGDLLHRNSRLARCLVIACSL